LETGIASGQIIPSWFDQNYEYRIEEGDLRYEPSKIEAVRRDGEDFDDLHLQSLKLRLEQSMFPLSRFAIYFHSDEFRRYVRIYIDFAHSGKAKGKHGKILQWSVVPKDEIKSRIIKAG